LTLLIEPAPAFGVASGADTQPFDFVGNDTWGHTVRGRVDAADVSAAQARLRMQGIAPTAVEPGLAHRAPYRVELSIVPASQQSVTDLVRRVLARRQLARG